MYENAYDAQSKKILSDKSVLSNILKECVPEYKNYSRSEIRGFIEDGGKCRCIKGISNDDNRVNNATIAYDILFYSRLPNSNENIGMYINVEAQNVSRPHYPLINRAVYYASRLIMTKR